MPDLRAVPAVVCRWHHCAKTPDKGFLFCPSHEAQWAADKAKHEAETDERQFVRFAYAEDCKLPYRPASLEAKAARTKGYSQPPINRVLEALAGAGCEYRPHPRNPDSWLAQCPNHDDHHPSLEIRRSTDGKVWLKDWTGTCSKEAVLASLGLEWRDLWEASEHDAGRKRAPFRPFLEPHIRNAMVEALRRDDERRAA